MPESCDHQCPVSTRTLVAKSCPKKVTWDSQHRPPGYPWAGYSCRHTPNNSRKWRIFQGWTFRICLCRGLPHLMAGLRAPKVLRIPGEEEQREDAALWMTTCRTWHLRSKVHADHVDRAIKR
jgi:hypothetical protein